MTFHPVTSELAQLFDQTNSMIDALIESNLNYIVTYPNNDPGSEIILNIYDKKLSNREHFRIFPSMRFEYFLTS